MWRHGVCKVTLKSVSVSGPTSVTSDGPVLPQQSSACGREQSEDLSSHQIQQELVEVLQLAGQRSVWPLSGCHPTNSSLVVEHLTVPVQVSALGYVCSPFLGLWSPTAGSPAC